DRLAPPEHLLEARDQLSHAAGAPLARRRLPRGRAAALARLSRGFPVSRRFEQACNAPWSEGRTQANKGAGRVPPDSSTGALTHSRARPAPAGHDGDGSTAALPGALDLCVAVLESRSPGSPGGHRRDCRADRLGRAEAGVPQGSLRAPPL